MLQSTSPDVWPDSPYHCVLSGPASLYLAATTAPGAIDLRPLLEVPPFFLPWETLKFALSSHSLHAIHENPSWCNPELVIKLHDQAFGHPLKMKTDCVFTARIS